MFLGGCPCCGKKECWRCYEFGGCDNDWINHILSKDGLDIGRFNCFSPPSESMCELAYKSTILVDCEYSAPEGYTDPITGGGGVIYYRSPPWSRQIVPFVFVNDWEGSQDFPYFGWQYLPDPDFFGQERPVPLVNLGSSCEGYPDALTWDQRPNSRNGFKTYAGPFVTVVPPCGNWGYTVYNSIGFPNGTEYYALSEWEFTCGKVGTDGPQIVSLAEQSTPLSNQQFLDTGHIDLSTSSGRGAATNQYVIVKRYPPDHPTTPDQIYFEADPSKPPNVQRYETNELPESPPVVMSGDITTTGTQPSQGTFTVYSARLEDGTDIVPGGLGE